ncbi:hypothetical protein D3C73_1556950 [compost metagenome]
MSQLVRSRKASCSCVSTPSAVTFSPMSWPMVTMELASDMLFGVSMLSIKDLSIFSVVMGSCFR